MLIDAATFDQKRKAKRPPMALASVAKKAGVSERTLARIKNKEEMNPSTVDKIAKALDTSIGELCAPSQARSHPEGSPWDRMNLELAAYRYQVSPELIEKLGPMLFVAVAELALKRRKERLDTWWAKVKELREIQPKFNSDSFAKPDAESGIESLEDAYWQEMEQIEKHSLDGWADDSHDHFFSALFSIYDDFELGGDLAKENDPFVYAAKFEEQVPDGKFPYPEDSLKRFEEGYAFFPALWDTRSDIAGTSQNVDEKFYEDFPNFHHPIFKMADEKLSYYVPLSRMPIELRHKDKTLARAEWILSSDGKEEIPEILYHWDAAKRITNFRHYEEEVLKLTKQLDELSGDERAKIEGELRAANDEAAEWKARIMPSDEEWYDKWETREAMLKEASGEDE